MGKPRNTQKYPTYPEIPEIPGNTRKKKRYPEIPDRIFRHSYPTRTRPATRYFVQYPTRPDPILKNPTRWALPPWPPRILDNDKFEFPPSFSRICNSCGLSFVVSVVSVSNGWSAPDRNSLLDDAASPVPVRLDVCQNKLSGCRFWGKKLRQKKSSLRPMLICNKSV